MMDRRLKTRIEDWREVIMIGRSVKRGREGAGDVGDR